MRININYGLDFFYKLFGIHFTPLFIFDHHFDFLHVVNEVDELNRVAVGSLHCLLLPRLVSMYQKVVQISYLGHDQYRNPKNQKDNHVDDLIRATVDSYKLHFVDKSFDVGQR